MPLLPWRTDADGFRFTNHWTFDSTEQSTLANLAASLAPAAVAAVAGQIIAVDPLIVTDPTFVTLWTTMLAVSTTAAYTITNSVNLPSYGMCGGMAYTSLDYWNAKAAVPYGDTSADQPMRTAPSQASLRSTIWQRLIDSLTGGGCLQQTIKWSLVLNQVPPALGGGAGTLLSWTAQEWLKIKANIDAGKPCPIGLLYNNRDIWDQHQILVYGYDLLPNGAKLYVYDNNFPRAFGDTVLGPADFLTFDLSGPGLKATSPDDWTDRTPASTLSGFFCTNYSAAPPPSGLATSFGEFITWDGVADFMTAYGAILSIANAAELAALGGTPTDPRTAPAPMPQTMPRPRDYALLRERSSAPVFLYQGGAPFHVPDPAQLMNFGGWSAVRVVPDNTLAQFAGSPVNGTLLREFSNSHVFVWSNGALSPSQTPATSPDVRAVPDGAIQGLLLDKVTLDYSSILVGGSCHGTVSLKAAFAGADITVSLASSQPTLATVPATVTIPKGALSATFTFASTGAAPPSGGFAVQVTATVGGRSVSTSILLEPPGIAQFSLSPQTVTAGQSSTATLVLASPYVADLTVNLFSYSSYAVVQAAVTIPKNTTTITFSVSTPPQNFAFVPIQAVIQASYANLSATVTLTIQPSVIAGIVQSISLSPASVTAGGTCTATVTLTSAVNVATDVGLTSHAPPPATIFSGASPLIASMPSKITIPAGQTQQPFTIKTVAISPQATQRTAVIVAIAVKQVQATLTLKP